MKYKKGTFVIVPNLERLDLLQPTGQALFVWLCKYADDDGCCFPSRARLAKHLNCDVRTVDRHINSMTELGFITKELRKKKGSKENTSNMYQIQLLRHPSDINDTTPSDINDTVTISSINSTNITHIEEKQKEEKEVVITTGQLPKTRGNTYIIRLLSIYKDLFNNLYGFYPTVPPQNYGRQLKSIMLYKSELQIALLMIIFFNWAGVSGNSDIDKMKLINAQHPLNWFLKNINPYEVYARNILNIDVDKENEVKEFVAKHMLALKE